MTGLPSLLQPFQYIVESTDQFLALFPHRYDYIWADRPVPGERPNWQTETRHPLSDRLLQQGKHLYGVRFGAQTQYLVLDIDAKSVYHPQRDRLGISRLLEALEPLGLVDYLACTSSYSGGIHLYIPFSTAQKTWNIAFAVQTVLQGAGFQAAPGQLELFPNPKLYVGEGTPNLYAAHRLPLQEPGSYLLSKDWELVHTTQAEFVRRWQFVAVRNQVDEKVVDQLLSRGRHKQLQISKQAEKFLNDLNAEIERGWTSFGQTNRLLGRITMRSYIFAHILYASEPLQDRALVRDIVAIAKTLPGYSQWCRHQDEIELRAEQWARCIENSAYFPYGFSKSVSKVAESVSTLTHNQRQQESARERIRQAIAALLETNTLPVAPTARFNALTRQGIGGATLYRHRDLWHPNYLVSQEEIAVDTPEQIYLLKQTDVENFPIFSLSKMDGESDCLNAIDPPSHQSLLEPVASNALEDKGLSDRYHASVEQGSNNSLSCCSSLNSMTNQVNEENPISGQTFDLHVEYLQQTGSETGYVERMQQYLQSDDPILQQEAHVWAHASPSLLQLSRVLPEPVQAITSAQGYRDVVDAIAYHLRRLGWSSHQVCDRLMFHFGKSSLSLFSDVELVQWLEWLVVQVN